MTTKVLHRISAAATLAAILLGAVSPAMADPDRGWNNGRHERSDGDRDGRWDRHHEGRWDRADDRWERRDARWDRRAAYGRWIDDRDRVVIVDRRPVYVDRRPIYAAPPRWTRYEDPRRGYIYYRNRPDVIYVHNRPYRTWYDARRQGYYYRDDNGRDVLLGVAIGAVGLAAVLAATR